MTAPTFSRAEGIVASPIPQPDAAPGRAWGLGSEPLADNTLPLGGSRGTSGEGLGSEPLTEPLADTILFVAGRAPERWRTGAGDGCCFGGAGPPHPRPLSPHKAGGRGEPGSGIARSSRGQSFRGARGVGARGVRASQELAGSELRAGARGVRASGEHPKLRVRERWRTRVGDRSRFGRPKPPHPQPLSPAKPGERGARLGILPPR